MVTTQPAVPTAPAPLLTAADLLALPDDDYRYDKSGYHLEWDPDTVRAPDVSFISAERLPPDGFPHSYPTLAPDLAVEVLSPSERPGARREKMQDYFAAETRLASTDELTSAEVLPGFVCRVGELIP